MLTSSLRTHAILTYCHMLPYCHAAILPCFHTTILPYCHAAILPCCHTTILTCCHTNMLPCCHSGNISFTFSCLPLPYCRAIHQSATQAARYSAASARYLARYSATRARYSAWYWARYLAIYSAIYSARYSARYSETYSAARTRELFLPSGEFCESKHTFHPPDLTVIMPEWGALMHLTHQPPLPTL